MALHHSMGYGKHAYCNGCNLSAAITYSAPLSPFCLLTMLAISDGGPTHHWEEVGRVVSGYQGTAMATFTILS